MVKAVFPGTFDPIHHGHIDIALRASEIFDELIVAVYDKPLKNIVFSAEDRLEMARQSFLTAENISVAPFGGLIVDFCQEVGAKAIIRGLRVFSDFEHEFRMAHANKRLAPDLEYMLLITSDETTFLSSSIVREIASLQGNVSSMVPAHVNQALISRFSDEIDKENGEHMKSLRD